MSSDPLTYFIFIAWAGVFILTSWPSLHWYDSGELSASAVGLGIAHPTGFPAYLQLAKLVSLLPVGSLAFRVNILSAFLAAGALTGLFILTNMIVIPDSDRLTARLCGFAMTSLVAVGHMFWLHATITEVYMFNACLLSWFLVYFYQSAKDSSPKVLFKLALISGIGCSGHASFLGWAFIGWMGLLILRLRNGRVIAVSILLGILGLLALVYLPLRSATNPYTDWGNPESWDAFFAHISGARIRLAFREEIGGWRLPVLWWHLSNYFVLLWNHLAYSLVLVPVGLWVLFKQSRFFALALCIMIMFDLVFSVKINPMGMQDLQVGIPGIMGLAIFYGSGVGFLGHTFQRPDRQIRLWLRVSLLVVCGLSFVIQPLMHNFKERFQQDNYLPYETALCYFKGLSSDGLIFTFSDNVGAGTLYLQGVENERPDVPVIVRQHITRREQIQRLQDRFGADLFPAELVSELRQAPLMISWSQYRHFLQLVLDHNHGRDMRWDLGWHETDVLMYQRLYPSFPLPETSPQKGLEQEQCSQLVQQCDPTEGDMRSRAIFSAWMVNLGFLANKRNMLSLSYEYTAKALTLNAENYRAWYNVAVLLWNQGHHSQALEALQKSIDLYPLYVKALLTLGRFALHQKKLELALESFNRVLQLQSDSDTAYLGLAQVCLQRSDKENARKYLKSALEVNPTNEKAQEILRSLGGSSTIAPSR